MRRLLSCIALSAAVIAAMSLPALAQDGEREHEPQAAEPTAVNTGSLSFEGGSDFSHAYYFRGYIQEDDGFIYQPYGQVNVALTDGENGPAVTGHVGIWGSLHTARTGSQGSNEQWYETDVYGGLEAAFDPVSIGVGYTFYTSPNGAFDTIEEVGLTAALDDAGMWGESDFSLAPSAGVYVETEDNNGSEDIYAEVAVSPTVYTHEDWGLSVSIPLTLGMSLDDYYVDEDGDDEFLGYASVAVAASIPLPIPARYGEWSLTGTVEYLHLLSDGLEELNNDDQSEILARVGINFSY
jgi:hypothetical protein